MTLLGTLDPVRAAEDYATLDVLSEGRVELVVGRGILRRTYRDFGTDPADSRARFEEAVELLLAAWGDEPVSWRGRFRAPLEGVTVQPRPLQRPHPPVWIGGGSAPDSVDLAARLGLPLVLPSVLAPAEAFLPLVDRYRERFTPARRAAPSRRGLARPRGARPRHGPRTLAGPSPPLPRVGHERARALGRRERGAERRADAAARALRLRPALREGPRPLRRARRGGGSDLRHARALGLELHLSMFDHGGLPEAALRDSLERFGAEGLPRVQSGRTKP